MLIIVIWNRNFGDFSWVGYKLKIFVKHFFLPPPVWGVSWITQLLNLNKRFPLSLTAAMLIQLSGFYLLTLCSIEKWLSLVNKSISNVDWNISFEVPLSRNKYYLYSFRLQFVAWQFSWAFKTIHVSPEGQSTLGKLETMVKFTNRRNASFKTKVSVDLDEMYFVWERGKNWYLEYILRINMLQSLWLINC